MNFIEKLMELRHPERLIWFLGSKGGLNWMNDSMYIKMSYYFRMNKKLDLKKPITYNEKLQWLKINNRNYMYTNLADKYEVRKLIKEKIRSDKLITLLEVKDKPEQINWDALPNQFVAKCNHDSGGVVICKDKKKFIVSSAEKKLNKSLSNNYYYPGREWPYKNIKPRIIIEEY